MNKGLTGEWNQRSNRTAKVEICTIMVLYYWPVFGPSQTEVQDTFHRVPNKMFTRWSGRLYKSAASYPSRGPSNLKRPPLRVMASTAIPLKPVTNNQNEYWYLGQDVRMTWKSRVYQEHVGILCSPMANLVWQPPGCPPHNQVPQLLHSSTEIGL